MNPLNPILAALLAVPAFAANSPAPTASAPASAQPASAPASASTAKAKPKAKVTATATAAPKAKCPDAMNDKDASALDGLICIVKSDRTGAAFRLAQWARVDRKYINPSGSAAYNDIVNRTIGEWVNKANGERLAVLYLVVGPQSDTLPSWENKPALVGRFKPNGDFSKELVAALDKKGWAKNQIKEDKDTAANVKKLLDEASSTAYGIWRRTLPPPPNLPVKSDAVVDAKAGGGVATQGAGASESAGSAFNTAGFGFNSLYRQGAKVGNIYGPDDKGCEGVHCHREISLKIHSVRAADGSFYNVIAIIDLNKGKPYPPKIIPLNFGDEQNFTLKDGGREYVLKNVDGVLTLARKGAPAGFAGSLQAGLNELSEMRANQIRSGEVVRIPSNGGQEYYTLPEGGERGKVLFFARNSDGSPAAYPAAAGDLTILSNGNTVPVWWKSGIGELRDGVNPDGSAKMSPFKIVFDVGTKQWKVVPGEGDPDPTKPKVEAKDPKADPKGTGSESPSGTAALLEDLIKRYPKWTADNGKLDAETMTHMRIMKDDKGKHHLISPEIPGQVLQFENIRMRGFLKYVILEKADGNGASYYTLKDFTTKGDDGYKPSFSFIKKNGMMDITDPDVAHDILTTYMSRTEVSRDKLADAAKKYGPDGKFTADKAAAAVKFETASKVCEIWPKTKCTTPGAGGGGKSPGTAVDAPRKDSKAGGYVSCEEIKEGDLTWKADTRGQKVKSGSSANDDVCLYTDGSATPRIQLALRFQTDKGTDQLNPFIFKGDIKPQNFFYRSLGKLGNVPASRNVDLVFGSSKARGVYGLAGQGKFTVATGVAAGDKKANCLGVVVWWGMDEPNALKACQEGAVPEK